MTAKLGGDMTFRTIVFIDTNVILECLGLDQLPWKEIDRVGPLLVLVTPTVLKEVDSKKHHARLSDHARRFNRLIGTCVLSGRSISLRKDSPRVEICIAKCARIDWEEYSDLDRDDSDSRVIAEVLNAEDIEFEKAVFVSHDISPLSLARARGLKVHHVGDNWLRPKEKSEAEKKADRLSQRVAVLENSQPKFEITFDYFGAEPAELIRVRDLTTEEKSEIVDRILDENPKPPQAASNFGIPGLFDSPDYTLDDRYSKYRDQQVPAYVEKYAEKLELMFNQFPLSLKVVNTGQVAAEALIITFNSYGGSLNGRYVVPSPKGPPAPTPRRRDPFSIPTFNPIRLPPFVGRHEIVVTTVPSRSRVGEVNCQDFRHGTEFEYRLIAAIEPRDGDQFRLTVKVTAANMTGETTKEFVLAKKVREVGWAEVVEPKNMKLLEKPCFLQVLQKDPLDHDAFEWDWKGGD